MGRVKLTKKDAEKLLFGGDGAGDPHPAPSGKPPSKGELAAVQVVAYCRSKGYPEPVREHRFHPERLWRWDLAWPDRTLAVEFQGGIWQPAGGGHTRGKAYQDDCEKYSEGAVLGWRAILATYEQLRKGVLWGWLDREFGEGT